MTAQKTLIYAGVAALVAALVQVVTIAQQLAITPTLQSPSHWAIAAGAGIVSAAALAALPWIEAVIPKPPAPPAQPQGNP